MEIIHEKNRKSWSISRIFVGLLFLVIGAYLFADTFDLITFSWKEYILTWPSLLIAIGLINLAKSNSPVTGIVLILIGGFFLAYKILGITQPIRIYIWPMAFVVVGLLLIFHKRSGLNAKRNRIRSGEIDMDTIDDVAILGGSEQKVVSRNFKGGDVTNIFGGSTFDMMEAQLAPGSNVLNTVCIFGGSKMLVPSNWHVKIETVSIFGGIVDKRRINPNSEYLADSELVIKGVVIFGGGEIKGY